MPQRLIRDGILSSERVCSLSWTAEVFYRRLMSVVDDYGRYYANTKLVRAACYPLQIDKVSDSDIEKWLTQVVEAALVRVYPAQDGKRYLEILDFNQRVQSKSKFPAFDEDSTVLEGEKHDFTVNHRGPPMNNRLGVVEDEVKNISSADASLPDRFEEFWCSWPNGSRKVARAECHKRWRARKLDQVADQILGHVGAMRQTKQWQDGFDPAPLTYLNQKRWQDGVVADFGAHMATPWDGAQ